MTLRRRAYLDWLRGIAVLIMIEGHSRDSWTRLDDRGRDAYQWLNILAGFGAPIFLFLAGVALSLAAGSRLRKGLPVRHVGAAAIKRGLTILGLAFLFRLQSWVISGGPFPGSLLKVDILNVMGVSMVIGAALWWIAPTTRARAMLFGAAVVIVAMATPVLRPWPALNALPDPIELYLRPFDGRATFTLLPWSAFLLAGAVVGLWLDAAREPSTERRVNVSLAVLGAALAGGSYAASFLPPLYDDVNFWTTSPAFFFLRLGILVAVVPAAYALNLWVRAKPLEDFGRASLFVYWIHVEMAYGVLSFPLHRALSLEQAGLAFAAFIALLFLLVKLKARVVARIANIRQNRSPGPVARSSVRNTS